MSDAIPEVAARHLRALHRLNGGRDTHLNEQAMAIASALKRIGVVPVFIKGSAGLLSGRYDDPAVRVMSDVDAYGRRLGTFDDLALLARRIPSTGRTSNWAT